MFADGSGAGAIGIQLTFNLSSTGFLVQPLRVTFLYN